MPTFAQNFTIGDVVYGLSQSRGPYINSLGADLAAYCRETGAFLICDEFNNRSFLGSPDKEFGAGNADLASTVKSPTSMDDINYNLDFYEHGRGISALGEEQKDAARRFYDALSSSRRSPETSLASRPKTRATNNDNVTSQMIRRACKFGLEHMIMVRHQTVHFALDIPYQPGVSINMTHVVNKEKLDGGGALAAADDQAAMVPITFSELRCCYRYRNDWMPTGRLKFYLNCNEVQAPWVSNPPLWQQYADARAQKAYRKKHPVKAFLGMGP